MLARKIPVHELEESDRYLSTAYGTRYMSAPVPRYELPEQMMPPDVAYQIIRDELNLDGNPALNLATFVTTWMEPQADRLFADCLGKNYIDQDEYPQTTDIHNRCVNMLAHLFHAPRGDESVGTATVGSSEAIHLAGLALKRRWRSRVEAGGRPADSPNIVMGHNVQVVWEKFARYLEVEPRLVPLTDERFVLGVDEALGMVDENTIGVVGVLGSTYTGEYEPIKQLNDRLVELETRTGLHVPIHVDAAGGGFVAPFVDPDLEWDFRLPLIKSINVSGHKYGLVYPGVGWVIWRLREDLPDDLIFHVNYLGGDQPTFSLNFSKGAAQVVAKYYNFLRLGKQGYRDVMLRLYEVGEHLNAGIAAIPQFEILGNGPGLPLVCFRLRPGATYTVFELSAKLRERGWIVPAYTLAPDAEGIAVLRVVVREGFNGDMADNLLEDLKRAVAYLESVHPAVPERHDRRRKAKTAGIC